MATDAEKAALRLQIHFAVGECMAAWAKVELRLMVLFQFALGTDGPTADAVFSTPRNFEIRSSILHAVMRNRLKDPPILSDWNLVYNHIAFMAGKRNEIAHATMVDDASIGSVVLLPYFTLFGTDKPHINLEMIRERTKNFIALVGVIDWFIPQAAKSISGRQATSALPVPDLLLQLRSIEADKREEQRKRDQPSDRR